MTPRQINVLLELRPALDQHGGIPQETRLLFRGLRRLDSVQVVGLLQSSTRILAKGLPASGAMRSRDKEINRSSRVVISLLPRANSNKWEVVISAAALALVPIRSLMGVLAGRRQTLTRFDPEPFKDFIWRALFARTLPTSDFDLVTEAKYRVARLPWVGLHAGALLTRRLGGALYPRIDTREFDIMIAETPYPGRVAQNTVLVVRYHDAVPLLMPHTISDKSYHQASHYHALKRNVADGAWFACVSESTRNDLIRIFPEVATRAVTIPNMVSHHYFEDNSSADRVPDILRIRRNSAVPSAPLVVKGLEKTRYLLMVSTIEPRKNHLTLLAAWEQLRAAGHGDLQLVFVGMLGWDHKAILKKLQPWLSRGGLHMLEDVPADELRLLYKHARITVCPSYGEGFDYSGVEAMRCGGVVAASDIPVHREIYQDAAEYFSPYSSEDLAHLLGVLLDASTGSRLDMLRESGRRVSGRFVPERIVAHWQEFFALIDKQRFSATA